MIPLIHRIAPGKPLFGRIIGGHGVTPVIVCNNQTLNKISPILDLEMALCIQFSNYFKEYFFTQHLYFFILLTPMIYGLNKSELFLTPMICSLDTRHRSKGRVNDYCRLATLGSLFNAVPTSNAV